MTLTTHVALTGPIDVATAFDLALRAILDAAGTPEKYTGARYRIESSNGLTTHHTIPGQGLPAITDATAPEDGTHLHLPTHLDDALAGWTLTDQTCSALVSWDTGILYRGRIWTHCHSLHAAAIVLLGDSLPADVEYHWQNENTGTWHPGLSSLRELTQSRRDNAAIVDSIRTAHSKETRS